MDYLYNRPLRNELSLFCVSDGYIWFSSTLGISAFNHFAPVNRICIVMSCLENDIRQSREIVFGLSFPRDFQCQS